MRLIDERPFLVANNLSQKILVAVNVSRSLFLVAVNLSRKLPLFASRVIYNCKPLHLAGKVAPDVIFQLGQGNFDALENIEDETTRNWASRRIEELDNAGAWNKNCQSENDKSNDFDPFADTWGDGTY
jgi:hypothetical protein